MFFRGLKLKNKVPTKLNKLMFKMGSCKYHCKFIFVAIILIGLLSILLAVLLLLCQLLYDEHNLERKKSVTCHWCAMLNQIKAFAFSSLLYASTRDVVLFQMKLCSVFCKDNSIWFVFLQTLEANIKSSISCSEGLVVVTVLNRLYCLWYYFFLELKTV
jgi:hypothetical protein